MRLADLIRKSVLDAAIKGELTIQNELDTLPEDLADNINKSKTKLIEENNIRKAPKTNSIKDDDIPFSIPDNWKWFRLGDLGIFVRGSGIKRSETFDEGFPCVRYGEIYTSYGYSFNETVSFTSEEIFSTSKKISKGDILFTLTGELVEEIAKSTIYLGDDIVAIGSDLTMFRSFHVYNEYLAYALQSPTVIHQKMLTATGSIIIHSSANRLKDILIPIPPIEEQRRIVEKIEEILPIVKKIENEENELLKLDEQLPDRLRKAVLQSAMEGKLTKQLETDGNVQDLMKKNKEKKKQLIENKLIRREKELPSISEEEIVFDIPENWVWNRLGNISSIYTGNSIPRHTKDSLYTNIDNGGIPYVATKDVGFDAIIDYDNGVTIPRDEPKFKLLKKNNVLLCIEGGSAGRKIGITDQDIFFGNKLATFESYIINRKFLFYYLQSPGFLNDFYGSMTGIIGGVGTTKLKSFPIPIPPLEEQQRIVDKLDQLFAEIDLLKSNEQ